MYEMLVGRPPFMSNDPMELFEKSLHDKIRIPSYVEKDAKHLIRKLTKHDLSERYGNLKEGIKDIKNHKFFNGFDFNQILKEDKEIVPYRPLENKLDKKELYSIDTLPENADKKTYPHMKPD